MLTGKTKVPVLGEKRIVEKQSMSTWRKKNCASVAVSTTKLSAHCGITAS
jgi:hypothetical protein